MEEAGGGLRGVDGGGVGAIGLCRRQHRRLLLSPLGHVLLIRGEEGQESIKVTRGKRGRRASR